MEAIKIIIEYLTNPEMFGSVFFIIFNLIRFIFVTLSIFFIVMLIFLLTRNRYIENRFVNDWAEIAKKKPHRKIKIAKDWERIIKQVERGDESEKKLALIEADDMTNEILGKLGYEGEKLEEKLAKLSEDIIPNLEDLKRAHKKRRDVVYDPGYSLEEKEAEEVILIYQKTLKDLQLF